MKPSTQSSKRFRREALILALIVSIIAVFLHNRAEPTPRVTISGLNLKMTVSEVQAQMGDPDFRSRAYGAFIMEYWAKDGRPQLMVWSQDDVVYKIEGGTPEVDSKSVAHFSLSEIEYVLGPPQNRGSSGGVGDATRGFLAYPEHRLLVQQDENGPKFILFKSGRE